MRNTCVYHLKQLVFHFEQTVSEIAFQLRMTNVVCHVDNMDQLVASLSLHGLDLEFDKHLCGRFFFLISVLELQLVQELL